MEIVPIRNLKPYEGKKKIRVRICRIWKTKSFGSDDELFSLQCILVDALGDAIQATVKPINYDFVAPKIEPGAVFDITHFHTMKSKVSNKVVPHLTMLDFNDRTIFKRLTNVHQPIPRHRFYLLDYGQLSNRTDQNTNLTDVIGRITGTQRLEAKLVDNTRLESKSEFYIENIRREEVRVTLWSEAAKSFNEQPLEQLVPPVFVAFTSLKVKEYQTLLGIQHLLEYCPHLQFHKYKLKRLKLFISYLWQTCIFWIQRHTRILPLCVVQPLHVLIYVKDGGTNLALLATNSSNVDGLICPKHKTIEATPKPWFKVGLILEDNIDAVNVMIIGKRAEHFFGVSCYQLVVEEGFVDQNDFPNTILQVRGQTKIFQLRFGTLKNDLNKSDLLIHAVFDDELPLLQPNPIPTDKQLVAHEKGIVPEKILHATPTAPSKLTPATPSLSHLLL